MTAAEVLRALRKRGYVLGVGPNGDVTATGVVPKDPERAAATLAEHQSDLKTILLAEKIMGGVLK